MPALQVRDFPEDLYEKLKVLAAREHRSVAQQTIVAVEAMVSGETKAAEGDACHHQALYLDFDTEAKRAARIKKRQELFERSKEHPLSLPPDAPSPVEVVRQGREERGEHLEKVPMEFMGGGVSNGGN